MPSSLSKSVFVQAIDFDDNVQFYSLALNVDNVFEIRRSRRGSIPVATPINAVNIPAGGGFAAVDNTVYYVGGNPSKQHKGCPRSLTSLFSFDTRSQSTKRCWKKHAPMRNARWRPWTVAVDGKIYVISGFSNDPDEPETKWAEVFDTKSGKWGSIPPPSPLPKGFGLFAAAATAIPGLKKFLLLGSYQDKLLHFFDAENGRWGQVGHDIAGMIPRHLQPVVVGTTLVWFGGCTVHAYDFIEKTSYSGPIRDLERVLPLESLREHDTNHGYPPLLHLSDNLFCLICLEALPFRKPISLLHCVTFCVSDLFLQGGCGFLKAAVKFSQAYVIETPFKICGAVVLTDGEY